MHTTRIRTATAALTLVAASSLAATASAGAASAARPVTRSTPVTPGSSYLALGDSVTFGYEEAQVVPAPNYHVASSFLGYPERLGAVLRLRVTNAACPGETSGSFINTNAPSNGCENSPDGGPAYRKLFPLHVSYSGSQLAFAVAFLKAHPAIRLVSLMIGANDLLRCEELTHDGCTSTSEQQAVFKSVGNNVRTIVSALRNRARYRGQLAIVNYYSPDYASSLLTQATLGLNRAVDSAATPFRVEIADGYGVWALAARHSGNDDCKAGLLTQLSTGSCGVHPSYAGQGLLALALAQAIRLGP